MLADYDLVPTLRVGMHPGRFASNAGITAMKFTSATKHPRFLRLFFFRF